MIRAVVRKELASLWATPVPYVMGAVFHVALGLLAVDTMIARREAAFQNIVPIVGFLLVVSVPVLTMRTLAEERRSGTLDVLLAIPVRPLGLVVGKWLAVVVTVVILLVPVALHGVLLAWWGDPDPGPMLTGAVGLLLLVGAAAGIGVAASSFTTAQPVAALAAGFVLLVGWFLRPSTSSVTLRTVSARLSLNERLRNFAAGGIDTGDVAFLVMVAAVGVTVAAATTAHRAGRLHRRTAAVAAVVALVLVGAQWRLDDTSRLLDVTAERSLSLTAETRRVIDQIAETVEVTAFLRDDSPGRAEAASLLDRYEQANRRIRASIVDPDRAPGDVRRLGADPIFGGVVLVSGGRNEVVPSAIESDLTLGLARLVRGELPIVCLTTGHGELDPESTLATGFSAGASLLADHGYEVRTVDLLAASEVDPSCGAVIVVGPAAPFGRRAAAVASYLDDDGRLAVFLEPGFDVGLDDTLLSAGLAVLPGIVAEGDPDSVFSGDATAPLVRRYSSASPIVRGLPPTFFVTVGGVDLPPIAAAGRAVTRLADTSERSLLVESPDDPSSSARPGPITVAAASETSSNRRGVPVRQRVVAVADVDVISNAFVGEAGNGRFLVQIVDWLTVDDDLVTVSSNLAAARPLVLTDARRSYARLLTAGVVPGLLLVAGGFVWAVRRSR